MKSVISGSDIYVDSVSKIVVNIQSYCNFAVQFYQKNTHNFCLFTTIFLIGSLDVEAVFLSLCAVHVNSKRNMKIKLKSGRPTRIRSGMQWG